MGVRPGIGVQTGVCRKVTAGGPPHPQRLDNLLEPGPDITHDVHSRAGVLPYEITDPWYDPGST
jgi:hypothetical protein